MQNTEASRNGIHRKQDNSAKRRFALVAVATTAVTTAGAAGATAGAAQGSDEDIALASKNTTILAQGNGSGAAGAAAQDSAAGSVSEAPQILEVPQAKPVSDLPQQLDSALRFAKERAEADLAARMPAFVKPAEGSFTSGFGPRWGTFHQGVDIANAIGTAIRSVYEGTVIDAGPASGFGNWVRVKHDDGTITVYGHMSTVDVKVGDRVAAGQKIAGMGSEGFSTGSHLHFEVHPNGGGAIDPQQWLRERSIEL